MITECVTDIDAWAERIFSEYEVALKNLEAAKESQERADSEAKVIIATARYRQRKKSADLGDLKSWLALFVKEVKENYPEGCVKVQLPDWSVQVEWPQGETPYTGTIV